MTGKDWLGKETPAHPPTSIGTPPPAPANRRFLVINPAGAFVTVWIDSPGACFETADEETRAPRCHGGPHHLYYHDGRKWAMRCPKSLSKEEQEWVFTSDKFGEAAARAAIKKARSAGKRRTVRSVTDDAQEAE